MTNLYKLLLIALTSALIPAAAITGTQYFTIYPIILNAEIYEENHAVEDHEISDHSHGGHEGHGEEEWQPEDGLERMLHTLLSNYLFTFAVTLILAAGLQLVPTVKWWHGVIWGLCGYFAFYFSMALIYMPTLPGTVESATLFSRQMWWVASVESTVFGLALAFFGKKLVHKTLGMILIVMPHIIGAPPGEVNIFVPDSLQAHFLVVNGLINVVYWVVLGLLTTFVFLKLRPAPSTNRRLENSLQQTT